MASPAVSGEEGGAAQRATSVAVGAPQSGPTCSASAEEEEQVLSRHEPALATVRVQQTAQPVSAVKIVSVACSSNESPIVVSATQQSVLAETIHQTTFMDVLATMSWSQIKGPTASRSGDARMGHAGSTSARLGVGMLLAQML